jgi:hypothetical protein
LLSRGFLHSRFWLADPLINIRIADASAVCADPSDPAGKAPLAFGLCRLSRSVANLMKKRPSALVFAISPA